MEKIRIRSLTSDPTSTVFLLVGQTLGGQDTVIQLDFSELHDRSCVMDKEDPEKSDFEAWTAGRDGCLLGRKVIHYRKKQERNCAIKLRFQDVREDLETCACTEHDFEWYIPG